MDEKRIAKNISMYSISQVLTYIFTYFFTIYTARYLGATNYGTLSLALAISSITTILIDLGFNTLLTRDVARDNSLTEKYISNIISIKLILFLIIFFLLILILNLLNYPEKTVVYIVVFSLIFTSISGIFYAVFQAHENLKYQSIGGILNASLLLGLALYAIYNKATLINFSLIYLVVGVIVFIYIFLVFRKNFFLPKLKFDSTFFRSKSKETIQFGLISIFVTTYVWIDTIILSIFKGNYDVGIYNVAYRLILILLFIPSIINYTIFPLMSKVYDSPESMNKIVELYFKLMLFVSLPLGFFITLQANNIIILIFGPSYLPAVPALQILIWATVFTFLNSAFVQLMQSSNRQHILTRISGICMVLNIIINLFLIPIWGYLGASIVTFITEFSIAFLVILASYKIGYGIRREFYKIFLKILISSSIMALYVILLGNFNLIVLALSASFIYLVISFIIGSIDKEDRELIKRVIS